MPEISRRAVDHPHVHIFVRGCVSSRCATAAQAVRSRYSLVK